MIEAVDSIISPQTTGQPIPPRVLQAQAVLGYVAGNSWRTYEPYCAARRDLAKKGWVVSVTLTCNAKARCYDIEPGGGRNENIGVFMHNADRSHGLPWLYTFASNGPAMLAAAKRFGFEQGRDFYYLSSHVGRGQHVCAPDVCGFPRADGTQFEFAGAYDVSTLNDYMLPQAKPAPTVDYSRFDDTVRDLGHGRYGSEREIVREYDSKRAHWRLYPRRLRRLRADLRVFADRLESVIDQSHDPTSFHRDWRLAQLSGRAAGKRYL